jgi:hypothetical protein
MPLELNYFVIFYQKDSHYTNRHMVLHLLQLNTNTLQCTTLDTLEINSLFKRYVVDSKNRENFVFLIERGQKFFVRRGCIKNDKLEIDENVLPFNFDGHRVPKAHGMESLVCKLEGNCFLAILGSFFIGLVQDGTK